MKLLISYIRSCFCKHEWELLQETLMYGSEQDELPYGTKWTYRCKKCGDMKTHRNY